MSNKQILNAIIKKHKLQQKAHYLFNNEPSLEKVIDNLMNFITMNFIGEKLPLVEECLIDALEGINEDKLCKDNIKLFLQNIVSRAYLLLDKQIAVETPAGPVAWVPMQEPINIFLSRYKGTEPIMFANHDKDENQSVSKREASLMLAVHIMPAYAVAMTMGSICEAYSN